MTNNDLADILITHIVNPFGIWGVNLSEKVDYECGNPLIRMSRLLQADYKKFAQRCEEQKYEIGQLVAVYCKAFRVWARGVVDDMYGENAMLVWLTDFGFHASKVTLPDLIMPLSNEALNYAPIVVQKFGLYGILPADLNSDTLFTTFETKPGKFWLPGSLKLLEDNLKNATDVKFLKKYVHTHTDGSKQIFGDFILTIGEKHVNLTDILLEQRVAVYDENLFMEALSTMRIILRTDRLAPIKISKERIEQSFMKGRSSVTSQCNETHYEYVLQWANKAAKTSNKNLIEPVEDESY